MPEEENPIINLEANLSRVVTGDPDHKWTKGEILLCYTSELSDEELGRFMELNPDTTPEGAKKDGEKVKFIREHAYNLYARKVLAIPKDVAYGLEREGTTNSTYEKIFFYALEKEILSRRIIRISVEKFNNLWKRAKRYEIQTVTHNELVEVHKDGTKSDSN